MYYKDHVKEPFKFPEISHKGKNILITISMVILFLLAIFLVYKVIKIKNTKNEAIFNL